MAVTPGSLVLPQTPQTAFAICYASKTTYSDATNAVRLLPAASVPNGALVKRLYAMPRATVSATQLQVYRSPDMGTTLVFADSDLMTAYTMSSTTAVPKTDFGFGDAVPFKIEAGEELWVGIAVALSAGIVFLVEYEAY